MSGAPDWLEIHRGEAPLLLSLPHTGTELPDAVASDFVDPARARYDADWWIERLYDFAAGLGATTVRTRLSRSVIDVNRDPSGASLYPGQVTTGLCPTETFGGLPLYRAGAVPDSDEIERRRHLYFEPYHAALSAELARLRRHAPAIVLYDCHSIRSVVPRLFAGTLPHFNLGTNGGSSCAPALARAIEAACEAPGLARVTNGRFKGGWITRHYGRPTDGIHAVQMELACRLYLVEPEDPGADWPVAYDEGCAAPARAILGRVLKTCIAFAVDPDQDPP